MVVVLVAGVTPTALVAVISNDRASRQAQWLRYWWEGAGGRQPPTFRKAKLGNAGFDWWNLQKQLAD